LIPLEGSEKDLETGIRVRDEVMQYLPLVLEAPHRPQLTEEQKNKIIEKLVYLANHEYKAAYYRNALILTASLRPGTVDSPTRLSPMVLKWVGYIKMAPYKEPQQKIRNAKNGRIIRNAKGL
jgi:hypothetical protein